MLSTTPIIADESLEDGVLKGFSEDGSLIVCVRYMPGYARIVGDESDERLVTTWRISPTGKRRIAAIAAWNSIPGQPTMGNA